MKEDREEARAKDESPREIINARARVYVRYVPPPVNVTPVYKMHNAIRR